MEDGHPKTLSVPSLAVGRITLEVENDTNHP
jgi:hypothetical protein